MASQNLDTARRAIDIISGKFGISREKLEEVIVSRMSGRIAVAGGSDSDAWNRLETEGEKPTAEEMIAFIVDEVKAKNPEKKKGKTISEIRKLTKTDSREM